MNIFRSFRDTISASPRLGWELGVLLGVTAFCFIFIPFPRFMNMTGRWYGVGWPFSTGAFKIGYVSAESPSGVHPYVDPTALLNVALWLAIYFTLRLAANSESLLIFLRVGLRVICFVSVMYFIVATYVILLRLF